MMDVILRLLGVFAERAGHVVKVAFSYEGTIPLWLVGLLAAALVALAFWLYRNTSEVVSPVRRHALAALRATFFVLLALILIRPVLAVTTSGSIRQTLLVLVDTSKSMQIADMRVDEADVKRAAIAKGTLDADGGLSQKMPKNASEVSTMSRVDVVKSVLKNDRLNLLKKLDNDYDLSVYSFDRNLTDIASPRPRAVQQTTSGAELLVSVLVVVALLGLIIGAGMAGFYKPRLIGAAIGGASALAFVICIVLLVWLDHRRDVANRGTEAVAYQTEWVDRLSAKGTQTALGDGIRDAILRKRGQPIAGVVVISDGASNSGFPPGEAAKLAKTENLPLFLYGVGITSPRDIIVGDLFAQDVSFVRDEVQVNVRVRTQGLRGQTARVVLKLGDEKMEEKEITLDDDGEQIVSMKFTPQRIGELDLTASIDPRSDEVVKDNNTAKKHIRIIDGRIKVLLVDQLPRWDFKYIQSLLLRDRRVEAKFVLMEADPAITDVPDSPYLKQFPIKREDLLKYDLVILGDVDPKRFSPQQLENLNEFVSKFGGGLIVIAGKKYMPTAYKKTPIEKLLPVEFEPAISGSVMAATSDKPLKLEITPEGKASLMLKLSDKDAENTAKWTAIPPVYWTARVLRSKPAAEVLAVDADPAKSSRFGKMPVIAVQQYGLGSVLYVGTDNTWRWRKNTGDSDHNRLWSQMVERMALPHLLGGSKRTQLNTDRANYSAGDRVTVFARLYGERDFMPLTDPTIRGTLVPQDGAAATTQGKRDITLRAIPDQPGMYRGEFVAPAAGAYRFTVDSDPKTPLDFIVSEPTLEFGETAMNETLLRDLAKESGGVFLREEDLYKLPSMISDTSPQSLRTFSVEFWQSPLYFLLLIGVVTAEWVLRKVCQLK